MELTHSARITIAAPRERVFDVMVAVETSPLVWKGRGAIPGSLRAEVVGGGPLAQGSVRRVHNTDRSVVDERIEVLERPSRQHYELVKGLKLPFTLLVKKARGEWTLTDAAGGGTEVQWHYRFFLTSPWLASLAQPVVRAFGKAMQEGLGRFKEHLEAR
jgi:uncharacterized protein YndB with AHSA1/START domain